jgi:hypothetical protein
VNSFWRTIATGVSCGLAAGLIVYGVDWVAHGQQQRHGGLGPVRIDPAKFEPYTVLEPQEPIVNPPCVSAAEAEGQMQAAELVLGVMIDGSARAYPINMLTGPSREIFNDRIADRSIAATW